MEWQRLPSYDDVNEFVFDSDKAFVGHVIPSELDQTHPAVRTVKHHRLAANEISRLCKICMGAMDLIPETGFNTASMVLTQAHKFLPTCHLLFAPMTLTYFGSIDLLRPASPSSYIRCLVFCNYNFTSCKCVTPNCDLSISFMEQLQSY